MGGIEGHERAEHELMCLRTNLMKSLAAEYEYQGGGDGPDEISRALVLSGNGDVVGASAWSRGKQSS